MMRDQSFDATAKIFIRGTLKTREALSGLDVVGADSFCILIYKARGLNADPVRIEANDGPSVCPRTRYGSARARENACAGGWTRCCAIKARDAAQYQSTKRKTLPSVISEYGPGT